MRRDVRVLDAQDLVDVLSLDPLGGDGGGGDGGSAAEGFEFGFEDFAVGVYADLELHDITAGGGTDETLQCCDGSKRECVRVIVKGTNMTAVVSFSLSPLTRTKTSF